MLKIVFTSEDNENSMFGINKSITNQGSLTNCLFLCAEPQLFKNNCMNKVIFKIKCLYL
jgi:hypothetical protein